MELRAGEYDVNWVVQSALDSHVTQGTFTFTVHQGRDCPSGEEQPKADTDEPSESDNGSPKTHEHHHEGDQDKGGSAPETTPGGGGSEASAETADPSNRTETNASNKTERKVGDGQDRDRSSSKKNASKVDLDESESSPVLAQEPDTQVSSLRLGQAPLALLAIVISLAPAVVLLRKLLRSPDDMSGSHFRYDIWSKPPG